MMSEVKIKKALISVFHKEGLEELLRLLNGFGVEFLSTGGTQEYIRSLGYECEAVENVTSYPSILGGRVKTLHPVIFGGILARRGNPEDDKQCEIYDIDPIDLVIVDLYPFEETLASGASDEDIIEKIDIGGISLIRGAAKNFNDVVIVPSVAEYKTLGEILEKHGDAVTTLEERRAFARKAFRVSSHYDTAIFGYFDGAKETPGKSLWGLTNGKELRYGENPHQKGTFYGDAFETRFEYLHGKAISYNNMLDVDAATHLVEEFRYPTAAIFKHNTPCGVASRHHIKDAYLAALASDPVSAYGGIVVLNRLVDKETAEELHKLFIEVLIAPDFSEDALEILTQKKNRIILRDHVGKDTSTLSYRSALGGMLEQERDTRIETKEDLKCVTKATPSDEAVEDLLFGMKVVKYCKSNAIVLAKGGQVLGAGYGQTSRVDALKQAIEKAGTLGFDLHGATLSSDAFFPFRDCVDLAAEAGITDIIQPGGSVRDEESIRACDEKGISMVMTGIRHFRH